jgi:hypothetical protein
MGRTPAVRVQPWPAPYLPSTSNIFGDLILAFVVDLSCHHKEQVLATSTVFRSCVQLVGNPYIGTAVGRNLGSRLVARQSAIDRRGLRDPG